MPSHVKIFAALGFFAVAYSVLSTFWFLVFPSAHHLAALASLPTHLAAQARHADLLSGIIVTAMWALPTAILIWFAVFRRSNIARWSYAILFVLRQSIPLFLLLRGPQYVVPVLSDYLNDLSYVRFYIAIVPVIAAIAFSFTGNARAWFARPRSPAIA